MNISKKAIMSVLMALTSAVSMAQPYYHIMKDVNGKLTEDTVYNGKDYNIKISMEGAKPKDAIGNKISVSCSRRSFYFTNKGNLCYDKSTKKFGFEESQLDYPSGTYSTNHVGHFRFDTSVDGCIQTEPPYKYYWWAEEDFYFNSKRGLRNLQEDLGYEKWAVLTECEWEYVCKTLGECGWEVDGKTCFLIDTTPEKSLLRAIESKNGGKTMSKSDFEAYKAQGLVCLPASGYRIGSSFYQQGTEGYYWSCTPNGGTWHFAWYMCFDSRYATTTFSARTTGYYWDGDEYWYGEKGFGRLSSNEGFGRAVRLVILADD